MRIKKYPVLPAISLLLLLSLSFTRLNAQAVWENYRNEIYNYLYRMSQKGLIRLNDIIRPVSREHIPPN